MVTLLALAMLAQSSTLDYADSLYRQGEYFRAAGEYHRWLFENPAADERPQALYGLGLSYMQGKRFAQAKDVLSQVPEASPWAPLAKLSLAKATSELGNDTEARQILVGLPSSFSKPANAQLGLIAAKHGDWREALTHFDASDPALARLAKRRLATADKPPALAAALSIVPGGGQLYLGRPSDALNALLFTSLTGLVAAYYFQRDHAVLGTAAAALSFSFWGGSVYGAAVEAQRMNRQTESRFYQQAAERVESLGAE